MKEIRVVELAERDIDRIWTFILHRSQSFAIADGVVNSLYDAFLLFTSTPEAGRRRDDFSSGLRAFPAGKYIIYYRESQEHIDVLRVIHGKRNQKKAYRDID